jgi:hypothetical protein
VTIMPVTAMRTPTKVNISSLDQVERDVLGSEPCVEFVCDGGTGMACTSRTYARKVSTRLRYGG